MRKAFNHLRMELVPRDREIFLRSQGMNAIIRILRHDSCAYKVFFHAISSHIDRPFFMLPNIIPVCYNIFKYQFVNPHDRYMPMR